MVKCSTGKALAQKTLAQQRSMDGAFADGRQKVEFDFLKFSNRRANYYHDVKKFPFWAATYKST